MNLLTEVTLVIDRPALAHFTEIAGTCCTDERQLTLYRAARGRPDMTQRFFERLAVKSQEANEPI